MNKLVIGLFAALLGAIVSIFTLYTNYRSSLDSISGWRSKLFDAASAKEITLKEVQVLRTALRYEPTKEVQENTFDWISNIMIYYCDYISLKYFEHHETSLLYQEQEIIRVFIRCLLKNHWEYNASMVSSLKFLKVHNKASEQPEFIRETYDKAKAISRTLENDDKEYDLIEKINKKMMGSIFELDVKINKNSEDKINKFDAKKYLDNYIKPGEANQEKEEKENIMTKISGWGILVMSVIVGVNFASNQSLLGLKPIGRQTNVLAVLLVVLLIINELFKKKK